MQHLKDERELQEGVFLSAPQPGGRLAQLDFLVQGEEGVLFIADGAGMLRE